jgi:hypothetical protein
VSNQRWQVEKDNFHPENSLSGVERSEANKFCSPSSSREAGVRAERLATGAEILRRRRKNL